MCGKMADALKIWLWFLSVLNGMQCLFFDLISSRYPIPRIFFWLPPGRYLPDSVQTKKMRPLYTMHNVYNCRRPLQPAVKSKLPSGTASIGAGSSDYLAVYAQNPEIF